MRGQDSNIQKCFLSKENIGFVVICKGKEEVEKYKKEGGDVYQVVDGDDIFMTEGGNQGILNRPPKSTLENCFGTTKQKDILEEIVKNGKLMKMESRDRGGSTNDTMGGMVAH